MKISDNTVVSLRYIMKNDRGEVVEDITRQPPVLYLHGVGNILPVLETALTGLQPGDRKSLSITDGSAAGSPVSKFDFDVIIDDVRAAREDELKKGKPIDNKCGPGCCC